MKTRLALAKDMGVRYNGIFDCMRRTVAEEGVRGLYSGFVNPQNPSRYRPLRAPFLKKVRRAGAVDVGGDSVRGDSDDDFRRRPEEIPRMGQRR